MITKEEVRELLHSTETFRVERTTSTGDMDKFQEAICAFSNDLPNSKKNGYLILPSHLTAFRSLVAKLLPYENFAHGVFANILRKPCRNKRFESEALFRFCSDELASKV